MGLCSGPRVGSMMRRFDTVSGIVSDQALARRRARHALCFRDLPRRGWKCRSRRERLPEWIRLSPFFHARHAGVSLSAPRRYCVRRLEDLREDLRIGRRARPATLGHFPLLGHHLSLSSSVPGPTSVKADLRLERGPAPPRRTCAPRLGVSLYPGDPARIDLFLRGLLFHRLLP